MKKYSGIDILRLPMQANGAGAKTIGEYLVKLGAEVWKHGEGFSGKRPFGNSCWEHEVYGALVKAEAIEGHFDNDGYLEDSDDPAGNKLIDEAFAALHGFVGVRDPRKVTILITSFGSETVELDRAEYLEAKAAGRLDHLLDMHVSDLDAAIKAAIDALAK